MATGKYAYIIAYLYRTVVILFTCLCVVIGACFLRFVIVPLASFRSSDPNEVARYVRSALNQSLKLLVKVLKVVGLMCMEVKGSSALQNIAPPYIVVANHPSALDSVVLLSLIPNSVCIAKGALKNVPVLSRIISAAGFVITDSHDHTIEECQAALASGSNLIFFPEGTRTPPDTEIGEFKPGAGALILRAGLPTLPVSIMCNPRVLYKGQRLVSVPTNRFEFRVILCDPLELNSPSASLTEERKLRPLVVSMLHQIILDRQQQSLGGIQDRSRAIR